MSVHKKSIFILSVIVFLVCSLNPFTFTEGEKIRILKQAIELTYDEEKDFFQFKKNDKVILIVQNVSKYVISVDGQVFKMQSQRRWYEHNYYTVEFWRPVSWYAYVAFRCPRTHGGVAVYVLNIMGRWYPLLGKKWIQHLYA